MITTAERGSLRAKYPKHKVINQLLDEIEEQLFDKMVLAESLSRLNDLLNFDKIQPLVEWGKQVEKLHVEMEKPGARRFVRQGEDDKLILHVVTPEGSELV